MGRVDHIYRKRFRVYPTARQAFLLEDWARACVDVWNEALEQRRFVWRMYTAREDGEGSIRLARRRPGDAGLHLTSGRYGAPLLIHGLPRKAKILDRAGEPITSQLRQLREVRAETDWLAGIPATITNSVLYRLDRGYQAAWRRMKEGRPAGFPRFASARRIRVHLPSYNQTHRLTRHAPIAAPGPHRHIGRIWVCGGVGTLKIRCDQSLTGLDLGELTIWETAGQWWGSIVVRSIVHAPAEWDEDAAACGINRGVRNLLTIVDENGRYSVVPADPVPEAQQARLQHLERKAARQHLTNNRGNITRDGRMLPGRDRVISQRERQVHRQIARMRAANARRRQQHLHGIANELIDRFQIICIERLDIRQMMSRGGSDVWPEHRGREQRRRIAEASWGIFARILRYKAALRGRALVEVPATAISHDCPECGRHTDAGKAPIYRCECGYAAPIDEVAARNVLLRGLALLHEQRAAAPSRRPGDVPENQRHHDLIR